MAKALEHLKILDLSRILAGPWATQVFADLGAEVIKVERPKIGDDTRAWGPPFLKDADGNITNDSSYFLSANRSKKSITIDIATKEGQDLVRELAKTADVLIENYKVGTLKRYGLDYETVSKLNPRLVYCSVTGFGQSGPYAPQPGYDFVFQGMGGLMSITGQPEGTPGDEPMKVGIAISDLLTGMYSATAILAALEHRRESGKGQYIDMALLDCVSAISSYQAINYFLSGKTPKRMGNAHSNMVPYQVFRCKQGDIICAVGNDSQYRDLCLKVFNRPDLADDERFIKVSGRLENRDVLVPQVAEMFLTKTMHEWMALMEAANVPCGPIYTIPEMFEDPQVQHRGTKLTLKHSAGVDAPAVANPFKFSETPVVYEKSAPLLGEHTDATLKKELGLTDEQIQGLRARGVI